YTDWYGGGVLAATAGNCPTGNLESHVNRVYTVRFLPAGIGVNGTSSSLSIINQHFAQGYVLANGSFDTVLKTVNQTQTIARFAGPPGSPAKVAFLKQPPATIPDTTPAITLTIKIVGFPGFPNNNTCTATINAVVFRP